MKIFIFNLLVMFNLVHGSETTFYNEQIGCAKKSVINGTCAGIALVPNFWFFMEKSKKQKGIVGVTNYLDSFKVGFRTVPNTTATIASQFYFEELSKSVSKKFGVSEVYLPWLGCFFGALFSAPMYDVMNRQTMGARTIDAFKGFFKQPFNTVPIVGREFCFLTSLRFSIPIADWVQNKFGKNQYAENGSFFAIGAIGSFAGMPFDGLLTCWQLNMPYTWKMLMKGGLYKATGVGGFNLVYQNLKKYMNVDSIS